MKKAAWKRILPIILALVTFTTSLPTSVWAGETAQSSTGNTISQNAQESPATAEGNGVAAISEGTGAAAETTFRTETTLQTEDDTTSSGTVDLLDENTTVEMTKLTLKATYVDEDGKTQVLELTEKGNFTLPTDATINMELYFVLGTASAVDSNTEYVYTLPTNIRVDVEADHQLLDENGISIGTVHISKDGTLTFTFNTDTLKNSEDVGFYVKFAGGLSSTLAESGTMDKVSFTTSDGSFEFTVTTTEPTEDSEEPEPDDVQIYKSGTRVINENGNNYIEWRIALDGDTRETLGGVITDTLPDGLTYVTNSAHLENSTNGTLTESYDATTKKLEITVSDVQSYYQAEVVFWTEYDSTIFGTTGITDTTSGSVTNSAVFNPDENTTGAGASNSGTVTITPDMVSKSGSSIDSEGYITWTVKLNQENLDLSGATYTDKLGSGQAFVDSDNDGIDADDFEGLPTGASFTLNDDGSFTIVFPATTDKSTYTITYKTKVTDFSQSAYTNTASLNGGTNNYDIDKSASVTGYNLLSKSCTSYNDITNILTWEIVVNSSGIEMNDVKVTDKFETSMMTYVSASEELDAESDAKNGKLVFNLGTLTEKKVITVTTKITDPDSLVGQGWKDFKNNVSMLSSLNTTEITATADKYIEVKEPDLISKRGEVEDGVIQWAVTVNESQLTINGMEFCDELPAATKYVEGTFRLQSSQWYDADPLYLTPTITTDATTGVQTISYSFTTTDTAAMNKTGNYQQSFAILYETRVTDRTKATTNTSYENNAKLSVTYEGNITVTDKEGAVVSDVVGGVVDKTYSYKEGNSYVDWTVKINEAGNDLKDIKNPTITDQLADYFDYVSGTLYKVDSNGSLQEVDSDDYIVTVVNRQLTVQLPKDDNGYYKGSTRYQFVFRTNFNCYAEELDGKTITNTASFIGEGETYTKESSSIDKVSFSSSSAGAVTNREIRVKKVDSESRKALSGAVFELYLGGTLIGTATSGSDGYAVFEGLNSLEDCTLVLKETVAPDGYKIDATTTNIDYKVANLKSDSSSGVKYYEVEIADTSNASDTTGNINIKKTDESTPETVLSGAVFGLYSDLACATLVEQRTTDDDGLASFSNMALGTYYLKEISSPEGYLLSETVTKVTIAQDDSTSEIKVTYVTIDSDGTETRTSASYTSSSSDNLYTLKNTKATASLQITKTAADSSATLLSGAEFGIYTDQNCTSNAAANVTTNDQGVATFTGLELGTTYYYKEITAPTDYVLDDTVHEITIGESTDTTNKTGTVTLTNKKAVGNLVITKEDDSDPAEALAGVKFTLYTTDGTTEKEYQDASGTAVTATTDSKGKATFSDLPFGTYVIRETNTPDGYYVASNDTTVTISTTGDTTTTIVNQKIKCDIEVTKYDSKDNNTYLSGAVFVLYAKNPEGQLIDSATTGADGKAHFYDIPYRKDGYYIKEVTAPEGYNLSTTTLEVTATEIKNAFTTSKTAATTTTATITKGLGDEKQSGSILFTKKGETTSGSEALENATFTLYDENDLAVKTAVSDSNGKVSFSELTYGTYTVKETKAPDGYVLDTGTYEFKVDSNTTVTKNIVNGTESTEELVIVNKLSNAPYISFKLMKTNSKTGAAVADATFELYKSTDGTTWTASGIQAVTGTDGIAYFKRVHVEDDGSDVKYMVKEISAPTGYDSANIGSLEIMLGTRTHVNIYADPLDSTSKENLTEDQILWATDVDTNKVYGNAGTNNATTSNATTVTNTPLSGTITITKYGVSSGTKLGGAKYTLYQYDSSGKLVEVETGANGKEITNPVTTAKDDETGETGVAIFSNLPVGTYYIKETKAPTGYSLDSTLKKVVITGTTQTDSTLNESVTYTDSPLEVRISKKAVGGSDELAGAVFEVVKSDPSTSTSTVIDTWTSGTSSHRIPYTKLEAGATYILSEKTAPAGYGYIADVTFKVNSDGTISTTAEKNGQTIIVRDTPITLNILKTDENSNSLAGAVLGIYDENDKELTRFTTTTSAYTVPVGTLTASASGYTTYTIKEISAPDGYEIAEDITFRVASDGTIQQGTTDTNGTITYEDLTNNTITMTDTKKPNTALYIRKLDADTSEDLSGATLAIYTEDEYTKYLDDSTSATAVTSWTSSGKPYKLNVGTENTTDLQTGKSYYLVETAAPAGYAIASPVKFHVAQDSGNYQIVIDSGSALLNYDKDTLSLSDQKLELLIRKQNSFGTLLKGAVLTLYEYDTATETRGTVISQYSLNENGSVTTYNTGTGAAKTITTSSASAVTILPAQLTPGKSYILHEESAPMGYYPAKDIIFTIDTDGSITRTDGVTVYNNTIVMEDAESDLSINKFSVETKSALAGSTLQLTSTDDPYFKTQTWTSNGTSAWEWDITDLTPGCTYTLTELTAPAGYAYAEPITFKIGKDDHAVYLVNGNETENTASRTVTIEDAKLSLTVSKQDIYSGGELAGAEMVILDESGKTVAAWTTQTDALSVDTSNLLAGSGTGYAEYTLRETKAPTGYNLAADITFAIDKDGKVYYVTTDSSNQKKYTAADDNKLIMQDEPMLSVTKLDTSGNPVAGAKLTITAKDDDTFTPISWTTTEEAQYFESSAFTAGTTYVLTETEAPNGYLYADSIEFTVDADGKVSVNGEYVENKRIVMLDYPIQIYAKKTDASTGEALAGARLVVKNTSEEVLYSFTTTEESVLLPSEIFTAPQTGEKSEYVLAELEAPDGYTIAAEIAFAIDEEGQLYVKNEDGAYELADEATLVMKDERSSDSSSGSASGSTSGTSANVPKTGDDTPLRTLIALCATGLIGGCTIFGIYFRRRKKRGE